jgi:hypothetical protein
VAFEKNGAIICHCKLNLSVCVPSCKPSETSGRFL